MASSGAAADQPQDRRLAASLTARYSDWVVEALDELQESFLLTDPAMPGHPIVYASRGHASLTGYPRREVLGRNARVFQGAATDRAAVAGVREAVRGQRAHQVAILNYRRDGSPHWVLLHVAPVFHAADGRVLHFLAVQVPIAAAQPRAACRPGRPVVLAACREEARVEEEFPCASHAGAVFLDRDNRGLEADEPRVASGSDKEKALSTANSIFSALNRYSELTGLVVCGKRCDSVGIPALSSSLNLSLGRINQSFVLTDPHLPDMPIIYASDAFLSLTGYSREEILGCNCRFLNGPGTSVEVLEEINRHICSEKACTVNLLNYRKDGSSFHDLLHVSPIRNALGKVCLHLSQVFPERHRTSDASAVHLSNTELNNYLCSKPILLLCDSCSFELSSGMDSQYISQICFAHGTNSMGIFATYNSHMQVAFHVWVHLDESAKHDFNGMTPEVWQLGAVGAVRVAVRSLSASGSLLRPSQ